MWVKKKLLRNEHCCSRTKFYAISLVLVLITLIFSDQKLFALDLDNPDYFVPVATAASPQPRISLTLSALTNSNDVLLLFFGAEKRDVYEQAKAGRDAFPVSSLLFQTRAPVHVFWAR